jgi:hypothetical protein
MEINKEVKRVENPLPSTLRRMSRDRGDQGREVASPLVKVYFHVFCLMRP